MQYENFKKFDNPKWALFKPDSFDGINDILYKIKIINWYSILFVE